MFDDYEEYYPSEEEIEKPLENGFCRKCTYCDEEDMQCKMHSYVSCGQVLTCFCFREKK